MGDYLDCFFIDDGESVSSQVAFSDAFRDAFFRKDHINWPSVTGDSVYVNETNCYE